MEKLKQNRTASFIAVALVYIIAAVAGVLVYRALDLAWWLSLLIADAVATVATFLFSLLFQNASVYDPYWSVQPPVILAAVALRRTTEPSSALRIGFFTDRLSQKENHPKGWGIGREALATLEGVSPCHPLASGGCSAADDRTLIRFADRVLHRPTESKRKPPKRVVFFLAQREGFEPSCDCSQTDFESAPL